MAIRSKVAVGLRLDPDLLEAVDAARGETPRTEWIERALIAALDPEVVEVTPDPVVPAPAPRASRKPKPIPGLMFARTAKLSARDPVQMAHQADVNKMRGE